MTIGILNEVVESHLLSKQEMKEFGVSVHHDFKGLESSLRQEMGELKVSLQHDMSELKVSLQHEIKNEVLQVRHEMQEMKSELIIKLGSLMVTGIAVVSALVKLL